MKRKVKVDLAELAHALQTKFDELHQYLDLETGEFIPIMDEFERKLEAIYEEMYSEEGEAAVSLAQVLEGRDDPDWQKEMILAADRVEQEYGTRYIRIERLEPYDGYRTMERFVGTVEDEDLRERLRRAIRGRGAFRNFKDVLADHPKVLDDWYAFKNARSEHRAVYWLAHHNIEPV